MKHFSYSIFFVENFRFALPISDGVSTKKTGIKSNQANIDIKEFINLR